MLQVTGELQASPLSGEIGWHITASTVASVHVGQSVRTSVKENTVFHLLKYWVIVNQVVWFLSFKSLENNKYTLSHSYETVI